MPTNRTRFSRRRSELDKFKLGQLINGPEDCLLAGCGYWMSNIQKGHIEGDETGFYFQLKPENQAVVREAMRADWKVHRDRIMADWNGDKLPWAEREFGEAE